ncbi:hypothetical protein CDD83_10312 [Cordyceps sp. RAO-2017]|nr:hypothetical protein CDD83_10312 [Cordyceps sp. RAO-2017]
MAPTARNGTQPPPPQDLVTRMHNDALLTPTTLSGRLEFSNPDAHADSSSSDSEFQAPRTSNTQSRHGRAMSNPFPSIFNTKKKKQDPVGRAERGPEREQFPATGHSPSRRRRGASARSKDFSTGNCMTCASLVRWPKELSVFKCTICATINDILPVDTGISKTKSSSQRRGAAQSSTASHFEGQPISLHHSKRLARQCLHSYMVERLCSRPNSSSEPPLEPSLCQTSCNSRPSPSADGRGYVQSEQSQEGRQKDRNLTTYEPKYVFDKDPTLRPPTLRPNNTTARSYSFSYPERPSPQQPLAPEVPSSPRRGDTPLSRKEESKRIFKPLSDYVISCFSSFACVNSSFAAHSRQPARLCPGFSIPRKPIPSHQSHKPDQSHKLGREPSHTDDFISELDPKTLLLGDFAENGSWWTGGQDGTPVLAAAATPHIDDTRRVSASPRSPNLNWRELREWYSSIVNVAEGWFAVYEEVSREPNSMRPSQKDLHDLERELLGAQSHVQRVLLKATELLLKRPGRPLSAAVDLRFLLIILENPLLYADAQTFEGLIQAEGCSSSRSGSEPRKPNTGRAESSSGHHSGIIKRIVGLLSNSSTECHNHLIGWFAKYGTTRFVRTKDLVSGFLTYRLLRQSDKTRPTDVDITAGLIPEMQAGRSLGAYLHDEIAPGSSKKQKKREAEKKVAYIEDWQIRAAARVLALLFAANKLPKTRHGDATPPNADDTRSGLIRDGINETGLPLHTSDFYNLVLDNTDLVADFESWESKRSKFSFCQYPFLLSIWAKTKILEYDARRQMQNKARDAFFDSIMTRRNINQYLSLDVRRDCLVDDSLKAVGEVIGSGSGDVKKALRITFRGEEGIDGGGLRKEWFLLLVREVFNPDHGMFIYDEDSQYCYFNPNSFETSDQFFLVGVVMGLAIYNSTILDVALPPFAFRKLLASAPAHGQAPSAHPRPSMKYSLADLADYKPRLARGLRQLLEYEGDVEQTFSLDFVVDMERYGIVVQVPLCPGGERKSVTNSNRREYVELYVHHVLDTAVARQFEPFKRGFYTVCGGNAFSLFMPEEIELLVRGSDEAMDIAALRAVAEYDNWSSRQPDGTEPIIGWFWESFQNATPADQRKLLLFITGSDRLPAMGAAMLCIKISCLGEDTGRYPIARTCFNLLSLWRYMSRERLEVMLWRAVRESEGFGLK